MTSSFQALSCITNSLNQPLPSTDDSLPGSSPLFQITNAPHFKAPKTKPSKTVKKIADQNSSPPAILEPTLAD